MATVPHVRLLQEDASPGRVSEETIALRYTFQLVKEQSRAAQGRTPQCRTSRRVAGAHSSRGAPWPSITIPSTTIAPTQGCRGGKESWRGTLSRSCTRLLRPFRARASVGAQRLWSTPCLATQMSAVGHGRRSAWLQWRLPSQPSKPPPLSTTSAANQCTISSSLPLGRQPSSRLEVTSAPRGR